MRPPQQSYKAHWQQPRPALSRNLEVAIGNYEVARESGTKFVPPNSSITQFETKVTVEGLFTMASAFSLSSYSHSTQINRKKIIQTGHNRIKNPNWEAGGTKLICKSMVEDLNSGRPRINQASDQSDTRIRDRPIVSPTRWALGHAASLWCLLNAGFTVLTLSLFNLAVSVLM